MKDENKSILNASHTLDLLNNLSEENEQLKQQVAFLEEFLKTGVQYEYYQKVYDENEQLKAELEFWKKQAKQCPMRSCK